MARLYAELHERKRSRQREGLFAVEGIQEIRYALMGGYLPKYLLLRGDRSVEEFFPEFPSTSDVRRLKEELFDALAVRGSASPALAVMVQIPKPALSEGVYDKVLVLEQIEKPGNATPIVTAERSEKFDTGLGGHLNALKVRETVGHGWQINS